MTLTIVEEPDGVQVWVSLQAFDAPESFVIGGGATRDEAIAAALAVLAAARAMLLNVPRATSQK